MSIEQMVRRALESEADAVTPVADVELLLRRGESVRRRRMIAVGTALALVAALVAASTWPDVRRAAEPVAPPPDGVPVLPVLWTISTGDSPQEVVIDETHRSAYVTERSMAKVSVFDMASLKSVDVIDVGVSPRGMALDTDAGFLYVANDDVATEGSVSVVDTDIRQAVHTVHLGAGTGPRDLAVDPGSHTLFVTESGAGAVAVVDTRTWDVIDTVPVRGDPLGVAIDPVVGEVYVADGRAVTVLDLRTRQVVETIPDIQATAVVTDPAAGMLVAAEGGHGSVVVVSTRTHDVIGTVRVGGDASGVQVDPDASTAYVTAGRWGSMAVIDLDQLEVVAEATANLQGEWFGQPAVDPDNDVVWSPLGSFSVGVIPRQ
jgi:YVTN family beta-propeller protein